MRLNLNEVKTVAEGLCVEDLSDVLADEAADFEPYEAAKDLLALVAACETDHHLKIIDDTVIAIFGWSLKTLLEKAQ